MAVLIPRHTHTTQPAAYNRITFAAQPKNCTHGILASLQQGGSPHGVNFQGAWMTKPNLHHAWVTAAARPSNNSTSIAIH